MSDHARPSQSLPETIAGVLTPMRVKNSLILGVRPFGGRVRRAQADGIASLAAAHGNGDLDLSLRGTLQIHGVQPKSVHALVDGLRAMGLVDETASAEARRNILITPFWRPGDDTEALAAELTEALAQDDVPDLPEGFSFAIDAGSKPVLQSARADVRIECDAGGGLILVADGMQTGKPVSVDTAIDDCMTLVRWFIQAAPKAREMKEAIDAGDVPAGAFVPRQVNTFHPKPGYTPNGAMIGLSAGKMRVQTLSTLAKHGGLRMTPWGLILVESARELPRIRGVITDPDNPKLAKTS